jgi:hypothetical protein
MTESKAKPKRDKNAKTLYILLSGQHARKEGSEWKIYKAPCEIYLTPSEWWALKERVKPFDAPTIYAPDSE